MNTNKQTIVNAIWADPGRAFRCQFRQAGRYFENLRGSEYDEAGKIRITLYADASNIRVYYNGSSREQTTDVFTYLQQYVLNTGNFNETLQQLAALYGVALTFTPEQRATMQRAELARDVAASLIEALRTHPDGPTAQYIANVRHLNADGVHFGELTADSIQAAQRHLTNRGKTWNAADFEALGLTEARARAGYSLVIPYYTNGRVQGFIYRNINQAPTGPKYLYSEGLGRGGYCDRLEYGTPAVVVEGQLDAVRLMQQGVKNVVAIGGAKIGADIAHLLRGCGITEVVYLPDHETDAAGNRKTKLIADALTAFRSAEVDGEPVIKSLLLADLPAPSGPNAKTDADSYGAEHPDKLRALVELGPVPAWRWEIDLLRNQAAALEQSGRNATATVQDEITRIFTAERSPLVRDQIRQYAGTCEDLAPYGVTPHALADLNTWANSREYTNRVKQGAADLQKAVEAGANPEAVGAIVRRLYDAQAADTRADWERQLTATFADELRAIQEQPDTLKTKWVLGNTNKKGDFVRYEQIEFYPADIAVFCAATSHGKTAVLFEAALDLVRKYTNKTFLFVSCEENKRQLIERALNVFLPIETTDTGKDANGNYCFIRGTRKRTIKAALRGAVAPQAYGGYMGVSEHFDALKQQITRYVQAYGDEVRPRLKFVHTEATAESICNNILQYVEQSRAAGVEVGAVFVDYMQLLTTDGRNYSRTDELKEICKALKDCAARTELPVIVAAQLNREVLRANQGANGTPFDNITVANIGESADIERIAHDIYLVWQTDKTPLQWYAGKAGKDAAPALSAPADGSPAVDWGKVAQGVRSYRIFTKPVAGEPTELKAGYLYVEQLKARDGITGGWGLFPFDGERGTVGENDLKPKGK